MLPRPTADPIAANTNRCENPLSLASLSIDGLLRSSESQKLDENNVKLYLNAFRSWKGENGRKISSNNHLLAVSQLFYINRRQGLRCFFRKRVINEKATSSSNPANSLSLVPDQYANEKSLYHILATKGCYATTIVGH